MKPHLQELLGEEEPSAASAKVGDGLPPPPTSMPKDLEPSPLYHAEWIEWHTRHVLILCWWEEPVEIPSHEDYQLFTRKVCASFDVLKVGNWAKGGNNDHTPLLAHPSIGKYQFLLPQDRWYGTQDYQLTQSKHTVTYARVLQYWAEKSQMPFPDQAHHLAGSMAELQWVMELLVSFGDEEVFAVAVPSNWMEARLPRLM